MHRQQAARLMAYGQDTYDAITESKTRRAVLSYLKKHGTSNPYRIARETELDYGNVRGAIFGNGRRFATRYSLMLLGLIKIDTYTVNKKTISLTPRGQEIADLLEQVPEWKQEPDPYQENSTYYTGLEKEKT